MIGLAQRHVPLQLHRRLAQATAQARQVRIVITDMRGHVVPGAEVSAWSSGTMVASGTTDSSGEGLLSLGDGSYDIRTVFGSRGYTFWSKASAEEIGRGGDVFIKLPTCSGQPILTTSEGITLVLGAAVIAGGFYWKLGPAKVVGEVLVGAAIFTALYRISCL